MNLMKLNKAMQSLHWCKVMKKKSLVHKLFVLNMEETSDSYRYELHDNISDCASKCFACVTPILLWYV